MLDTAIPRTAMAIQPETSLVAAIINGQDAPTRMNTPRYWRAKNDRDIRQLSMTSNNGAEMKIKTTPKNEIESKPGKHHLLKEPS
jgi:hypothetical protein